MNSGQADVIFEIDIERAVLILHQSGAWAEYFECSGMQEYLYKPTINKFTDTFVECADQEAFRCVAGLEALQKAFAERIPLLSADVRIRKPKDSVCEWYRITIIAPIEGKSSGTIHNIQSEKQVKHTDKDNYAFFSPAMTFASDNNKRLKNNGITPRKFNLKRAMPWTILLLLVIMILGMLAYTYMLNLKKMVREDSLAYLNEIAAQISINIVNTMDSYVEELDVIGDDLTELATGISLQQLCASLQQKSDTIGCDMIAGVDDKGIWYTDQWQQKIVVLDECLAECVADQSTYMSKALNVLDEDYILIFVPVNFTTAEKNAVCAIVAFIRLEVLNEIMSLSAFEGAGHVNILTTAGQVIVRSRNEYYLLDSYNMLAAFKDNTFTDEAGFAGLKDSFTAGQTGSSRIIVDGVEHIFYFSKLNYQDWMLLASVPANILEARSQAFLKITALSCAVIALVFCSLMVTLIFVQTRSKSELKKLAFEDRITGGANREKFQMEAKRLLSRKDKQYSMIYTNVDRFKVINDRMGIEGANGLLKHIAQILQNTVLYDETVGRIDADHFGVLLNLWDKEKISRRIREWNRLIAQYPPTAQAGLTVSMSYGVYAIDNTELSVDILLDRSNLARSAKLKTEDSSQRIYFYDDKLRELLLREQLIGDNMEQALAEDRFLMYLQPQYEAATERLVGYEALVRWQTKNLGLLSPNSFIPVLERNGFIVKLDLYMFEQVCRLQSDLQSQGLTVPRISFNVSRVHLNSDSLLDPYLAVWEKYQVAPQGLEFEFTESVISDNPEKLELVIDSIHQHGFRCSMDDFGSGYSSLNMLHQTNVDVVKIDKSFLGSGQELSLRSKAIIRAVVSLANELGMTTVAEGVEYEQQADFLREIGCSIIQGYYYARPLPVSEALDLLKEQVMMQ